MGDVAGGKGDTMNEWVVWVRENEWKSDAKRAEPNMQAPITFFQGTMALRFKKLNHKEALCQISLVTGTTKFLASSVATRRYQKINGKKERCNHLNIQYI